MKDKTYSRYGGTIDATCVMSLSLGGLCEGGVGAAGLFVEALSPALSPALEGYLRDGWSTQRAHLAFQLLCACQFSGDCRLLLQLLHQLLPAHTEVCQSHKTK